MGATHTVQAALTDWRVPTGRQMTVGAFVQQQNIAGGVDAGPAHFDTPEQWAQMVNNLYEYMKPPALVCDVPRSAWTSNSSPGWTEIARYMVSAPRIVGTGLAADRDNVKLVVGIKVTAGTGEVRITGNIDSATASSVAVALEWQQSGVMALDDTVLDDEEIIVEARCDTGGTVSVEAIEIHWANDRATLPNGKYANEFVPCDPANYGDHQPLSVERMNRLIQGLAYLKRHRTGGRICSVSSRSDNAKFVDTDPYAYHGFAYQNEYVRRAKIWLYAKNNGADAAVTIHLGTESRTFDLGLAAYAWYGPTILLSRHTDPNPRELEFYIEPDTNGLVIGCCAYWMPIEEGF